jgi:hypothetical protein
MQGEVSFGKEEKEGIFIVLVALEGEYYLPYQFPSFKEPRDH